MTSININDLNLTTTELQELDSFADSENSLKDLSGMELNNVQGGISPDIKLLIMQQRWPPYAEDATVI